MPNYGPIDTNAALRASGAAVTTTTAETALPFDPQQESFAALVNVTALVGTGTYQAVIEATTAADTGFASAVEVGRIAAISAVGQYEIPLSGPEIQQRIANAGLLRVRMVIGGTSPSISYTAWLVPAFRT
ncbi:hypothetical protein WDZ92_15185 [Nostoc sp. NIES-2111]